jgi:hypothetical protein
VKRAVAFAIVAVLAFCAASANAATTEEGIDNAYPDCGYGFGRRYLIGKTRWVSYDFCGKFNSTAIITTDRALTTGTTTSSGWYNGCLPSNAFGGNVNSRAMASWANGNRRVNIVYSLTNGTSFAVGAYQIWKFNQNGSQSRCPKDWTVYGSNDYNPLSATSNDMSTATWTVIDTRSNETEWPSKGYPRRIYRSNRDYTNAYSAIRFEITANNGDNDWMCIGNIDCLPFFSGGDLYPDGGFADVATNGTATVSPEASLWYNDQSGTRWFDDKCAEDNNRGIFDLTTSANNKGAMLAAYTFTRPQVVNAYRICGTMQNWPSRCPKAWTLLGSNDYNPADADNMTNATWTVIDRRTDQTGWANAETRAFVAAHPAAYKTVLFRYEGNQGSNTDGGEYGTIYEMEFLQTPALYVNGASSVVKSVLAFDPVYSVMLNDAQTTSGEFATVLHPGDTITLSGAAEGVTATCTGYTLETFDPLSGEWSQTASGGDTEVTLEVGRKIQRLVWNYADGVQFTMTASAGEGGTVDKASATVAKGGSASFTATPASESLAVAWSGDIDGATYSDNNKTITLPGDKSRTVAASFVEPRVFTEDATFNGFSSFVGQLPVRVAAGTVTLGSSMLWSADLPPLGSPETPIVIESGATVDINNPDATYVGAMVSISRGLATHEKTWIVAGDGEDGNGALQNNGGRNYYTLGRIRLAGDASIGGSGQLDITPHTLSAVASDRASIDCVDGVSAALTIKNTVKIGYCDIDLKAIKVSAGANFAVTRYSKIKTDLENGGCITLADGSKFECERVIEETLRDTAFRVTDGEATILFVDYFQQEFTNHFAAPVEIAEGATLTISQSESPMVQFDGDISGAGSLVLSPNQKNFIVNGNVSVPVAVNDSGTVTMNGKLSGGVSGTGTIAMQSGSTLAAAASGDTAIGCALTFADGASFEVRFTDGASAPCLVFASAPTVSGTVFVNPSAAEGVMPRNIDGRWAIATGISSGTFVLSGDAPDWATGVELDGTTLYLTVKAPGLVLRVR